MKKLILALVVICSMNSASAENEAYFTVCSNYAHKIATFNELANGTDYYAVYFAAYGDCIEKYY